MVLSDGDVLEVGGLPFLFHVNAWFVRKAQQQLAAPADGFSTPTPTSTAANGPTEGTD
jgi:hypothetical protein